MHRKELSHHSRINLIQPNIEICKITPNIISLLSHRGKKVKSLTYYSNSLFIIPSYIKLYRKRRYNPNPTRIIPPLFHRMCQVQLWPWRPSNKPIQASNILISPNNNIVISVRCSVNSKTKTY